MASSPPPTLTESIAAAQAWWREAGVDLIYHDEPQPWLTADKAVPLEVAHVPEVPATPSAARLGGDPAGWPRDLAGFRRWWLEEPGLDEGGGHPRVLPRGEAAAQVMFLVPMPEAGDAELLLAGPQGKLLASLAQAMGISSEQVYVAAALPRHTPLPDWQRLTRQGLGDVLAHHIALTDPARLIVFGSNILPLLGHDPAQAAPVGGKIAIQGRQVPLLATFAPERLLGNARQRASLWQRWLEWDGREE